MAQPAVGLSAKIEELKEQKTKSRKLRAGGGLSPLFFPPLPAGKTPYDEVMWETRTAAIGNDKGAVIFEQRDIETPADWSQTATNIVASKYFHGKLGTPGARNQRRRNWSTAWSTPSPIGARPTATSRPTPTPRISATSWPT